MELTEEEALLIVILVSYYFCGEKMVIAGNSNVEGLGEVKLLRRIVENFPSLGSHVELVLSEEEEIKEAIEE